MVEVLVGDDFLHPKLVDKVVLRRDNDQVAMRVVWRGGDATEEVVPITVGRFEQLSHASELEETILTMAKQGRTDKQIAAHLTNADYRSPRSHRFLPSTVARIRMQHGILHKVGPSRPHAIPGYLRAHQLAKQLSIKPHWIYDRINNGVIKVARHPAYSTYLFPDQPDTLEQLKRLVQGDVESLAF